MHDFRPTTSATELVTRLELDPLKLRRTAAEATMMYKIMAGLVEVAPQEGVTDHVLTSSTSSLMLGTTNMTSHPATDMVSEKPYEEFAEVMTAVLIDRIYIPIVVSVGVLGNFLCFVTLVFTSLRNTSTCVYMAVIAVLDCVILILDFCVLVRGYLGHTDFYLRNDWACGFHNFLFYFAIHFDVLLLLAMTVDRFIVVKFPLKAPRWCTPKSAIKVTTGIGLFSFALNFQIFFNRRLGPSGSIEDPLKCWYPDEGVDFFMRKIYTWIDASIYSFIPFVSLLILNILIIRQLKVSQQFSKQFTKRQDGKSNNMKVVLDGDTYSNDGYTFNTELSDTEVRTTVAGEKTENSRGVSTISGGTVGSSRGGDGRAGAARKAATSANITVMLLLVSFTFLMLTSPVVIVLLYKRYLWLPSTNAERARARLTHAFVDNLMYTNHAVNFLLYCISGRRFRVELKRLLGRSCCRG
ncbi:uncharacterized protein LOC143292265 [Babylonia areolata]|uniref:uncharacterized protein LOC143292265 n=1 Tax=Babylonia areolata TaxID=304850 RepID=UPI003FD48B4D